VNFRIFFVAGHDLIAPLVPPSVTTSQHITAVLAMRAACVYCIARSGRAATIVATPEQAATAGNSGSIYFVSPHDVKTFADLIPPAIWREEATKLLKLASHDYAMSAKYDKAHACAVLAGIKSPLVHELERIAELKQLEKQ
jgi:hypothetical protein